MRQTIKRRVEELERKRRSKAARLGCPPVAIGFALDDGTYEVAGQVYTEADLERCFPGKTPFIVLNE
jgi:hypothetical protein